MHKSYIIPGVIDAEVIRAQAHKRANDKFFPESTEVHFHHTGEKCNDRCYTINPEEETDG